MRARSAGGRGGRCGAFGELGEWRSRAPGMSPSRPYTVGAKLNARIAAARRRRCCSHKRSTSAERQAPHECAESIATTSTSSVAPRSKSGDCGSSLQAKRRHERRRAWPQPSGTASAPERRVLLARHWSRTLQFQRYDLPPIGQQSLYDVATDESPLVRRLRRLPLERTPARSLLSHARESSPYMASSDHL